MSVVTVQKHIDKESYGRLLCDAIFENKFCVVDEDINCNKLLRIKIGGRVYSPRCRRMSLLTLLDSARLVRNPSDKILTSKCALGCDEIRRHVVWIALLAPKNRQIRSFEWLMLIKTRSNVRTHSTSGVKFCDDPSGPCVGGGGAVLHSLLSLSTCLSGVCFRRTDFRCCSGNAFARVGVMIVSLPDSAKNWSRRMRAGIMSSQLGNGSATVLDRALSLVGWLSTPK